MQMFVSNRDIVVRSAKCGQAIRFTKGVPQEVPAIMHEEVLEKGVLPVTNEGDPVVPAKQEVVKDKPPIILPPEDGDERLAAILDAIKAIVAANNSSMFTGGGVPQAQAVSQILGWRVDSKDVRLVWEKNREALLSPKSEE